MVRIGSSSMVWTDNIPKAIDNLLVTATAATAIGADEVKRLLLSIFENEGNGHWLPNQPSTIESKGADKQVMEDLRQLVDGLRIIPINLLGPIADTAIGWDDSEVHTSHGPIGMGSLAEIHDKGRPDMGIPARPWISQFANDPDMLEKALGAIVAAIRLGTSTVVWDMAAFH